MKTFFFLLLASGNISGTNLGLTLEKSDLSFADCAIVFGLVVTMTGGGPGFKTYVVPYFIYTQALVDFPFRYGYASAAAVLFGVTILMAVMIQGYFVRRSGNEGAN